MSLVEKAAKRLEELRNAGSQVAGELAFPTQPDETDEPKASRPSTIERVAQEIEKRQPAETSSYHQPQEPVPASEPASELVVPDDAADRREPTLATPLAAPRAAPESLTGRAFGPRRSRQAEIDVQRLAGRGVLTPESSASQLANELRVIKRPVLNNCLGKGASRVPHANRIMVTSSAPDEGKSFVSLNLAISIAMERDSTVLLVEADPARPTLHELMGMPPSPGLLDLLLDPQLDVSDAMVRTNLGRLSFIPAGSRHEHATELLASAAMERLVLELGSRYQDRILVFDAPPLLVSPEPRAMARLMGQVLFVVEANKTSPALVQEALSTIEACPVVLLVLNKTTAREEQAYYYSG